MVNSTLPPFDEILVERRTVSGCVPLKNVPCVIRLSLSLVSPSLGSGCIHTEREKVGSLLSCCWQLRKTMPIHSLGIEALSGPDQTLFVGFEREIPLSLHSLTGNKKKEAAFTDLLCLHTAAQAERLTTKKSVVYDIPCFREKYMKTAMKKDVLALWVLLLELLPGFTSVNLDKAQARDTSAHAGSMNVSLLEKEKSCLDRCQEA